MNEYDIFKSEGGYRVCGATCCDGPVIDASPWFKTRQEAEQAARDMRYGAATEEYGVFRCDMRYSVHPWGAMIDGECYSFETERSAKEALLEAIIKLGYTKEYIFQREVELRDTIMTITVYRVKSKSIYEFEPDSIALARPTDSSAVYRECRVILPDGYTVREDWDGPCVYSDKGHECKLKLREINHSNIVCVSRDGIKILRNAHDEDETQPIPLWKARRDANLSQRLLADASGVSIHQIQQIESGEIKIENIAAKTLMTLAEVLEVDPRTLTGPTKYFERSHTP